MTRTQDIFARLKAAGEKAFVPYLTCGDPNLARTAELLLVLEDAGAHVIELVVPFSDRLADGPPIGLKMTKRAILRGSTHSLDEYLEFERLAYQNCYFSEDSKEARRAFLEKRPPKFQGR